MHAAAYRAVGGDPRQHLRLGQSQMLTDGDGHGGGIDHVRAGGGDGYLIYIPRRGDGTGHAVDAMLSHVGGPNAAAFMLPAQHRFKGQRQTGQQLVVAVQYGKAARL